MRSIERFQMKPWPSYWTRKKKKMQRAAILGSQTNLEGVELSLSENFSFALINYISPGHVGDNAL